MILNSILEKLSGFLYPNRCPYCDAVIPQDEYACKICRAEFPRYSMESYAIGGFHCAAPFRYDGIFADAVKRMKFKNRPCYGRCLAFAIVSAVPEIFSEAELRSFDCVTCVPMYHAEKRVRHYNQAEVLGSECAKLLGLPYVELLEKHKQNKKQHTLSRAEKFKNVKGVYRVLDKSAVRGRNILLIDDVITTGATMGECARMLKKAHCKSVCCAAVCAAAAG